MRISPECDEQRKGPNFTLHGLRMADDKRDPKSLRVAIIGGGLGGFTVGIALLQRGFKNVTVYEKDAHMDVRRQGYGLTILQGISALKQLQLFNQILAQDTPSRSHLIFNKNGQLLGFFGTELWGESSQATKKKYNLHVQRQELRRILVNKYTELHPLGLRGIAWNCQLLNITSRTVSFWNQNDVYDVDLVIGADGINSAVRMFKYEPSTDSKLDYLGIIVVLGITPSTGHFLTQNRVFQTLDGCFRIFAMPFSKTDPSQSTMWQLSFPLDLQLANQLAGNPARLKEFVFEHCKDWHPPIPQMISNTPVKLLMGIPAFDRNLDVQPELVKNSGLPLVLIGDAAHPMSPFKGQGANQALLDSVELAKCMDEQFKGTNHSFSLQTALSRAINQFEQKMMDRVKIKVQQSHERVISYHRSDALNEENFFYRGLDAETMQMVRKRGIDASWKSESETIEEALSDVLLGARSN